jgi:hypothetical protein
MSIRESPQAEISHSLVHSLTHSLTAFCMCVVVEARELPKYCHNSYCIVGLGKAHQVRTQTVWKAKEPMWSENFHMYVSSCITSVHIVSHTLTQL